MREARNDQDIGKALVVAACLLVHAVNAQERVELKFQVFPMNGLMVRIDDQAPAQGISAVSVEPGTHRFRFWAPGFAVWDTILHVAQGQDALLRKVLRHSPDHIAYQEGRQHIARQKAALRGVPLLATAITGYLSLKSKKDHDQAYDDLLALQDTYEASNSVSGIGVIKQESLPDARSEVDRTRKALTTNLAICGVAVAATVYGFMRAAKLEYPAYEDRDKVRFEGLSWIPDGKGGTWLAGLTIPIR